jgi:hypothetical protein
MAVSRRRVEEFDMFIHLPIAMTALLSPIAVSDAVPTFDIGRECRFESQSTPETFNRCSNQEIDARQKLQDQWAKYVATDKRNCLAETTIGGFVSYVELLICLELANDMRHENVTPPNDHDLPVDGLQEMTDGEGRHPR